MTHFLTADQHFGHAAIAKMCNRPFDDRDPTAMDEALVAAWNARIRPGDDVWHLGDLTLRAKPARLREIFDRLNGTKRLVRGNHDHQHTLDLPWAEPPRDLVETTIEGQRLVLCHYPMRAWRGSMSSTIHCYGHVHGLLPATRLSCDVGVDAWALEPASLAQVMARVERSEIEPEEQRLVRERRASGG